MMQEHHFTPATCQLASTSKHAFKEKRGMRPLNFKFKIEIK
jgi:hypothetical protein